MNWTQVEGKWLELKAAAKTEWGKLTEDDLAYVNGQKDKLIGKLQERYGVLREKAQHDVDAWFARVGSKVDHVGDAKNHVGDAKNGANRS
jgi:uncharacterized protein YjbJ (UPF0337 family)